MALPHSFLDSLEGLPGFDRSAFLSVHQQAESPVSIRVNPRKTNYENPDIFPEKEPVPWSRFGYYLPSRPVFTLDPLLHAGAYYVQEASSMVLEQAYNQLFDTHEGPLKVLDLCAAPGGKSTHLQSLLGPDDLLVSNEVIRTRIPVLMENLSKWGMANGLVTNNDAADFGQLGPVFDVLVVDAPCSGSGLFRKDPSAIEEWSPGNVALCGQRQQRILADVWPSLKAGGLLIYSTCSYSETENEAISDWLTEELEAECIGLQLDPNWGMLESLSGRQQNPGYRVYPNLVRGEGFFMACFRKQGESTERASFLDEKQAAGTTNKMLLQDLERWLKPGNELKIYQHENQVFGMPMAVFSFFTNFQKRLQIRKAGIKLGDWNRTDLAPDHALAMSGWLNNELLSVELTEEQAIQYLRKREISYEFIERGWIVLTFRGRVLGWIKSMGNRYNNYYPKEWRIRM